MLVKLGICSKESEVRTCEHTGIKKTKIVGLTIPVISSNEQIIRCTFSCLLDGHILGTLS